MGSRSREKHWVVQSWPQRIDLEVGTKNIISPSLINPQKMSTDVSEVRTASIIRDNHFTRQYNPEDNSEHHTRRRENLKSHLRNLFFIKYLERIERLLFLAVWPFWYCPQVTSWSLQSEYVLSALRGEYKAWRWTEDVPIGQRYEDVTIHSLTANINHCNKLVHFFLWGANVFTFDSNEHYFLSWNLTLPKDSHPLRRSTRYLWTVAGLCVRMVCLMTLSIV
jgi:hypothetical protein